MNAPPIIPGRVSIIIPAYNAESTVAQAIDFYGAESWRDVRRLTGAGDGCTGCHCAIKDLLARKRAAALGIPQ